MNKQYVYPKNVHSILTNAIYYLCLSLCLIILAGCTINGSIKPLSGLDDEADEAIKNLGSFSIKGITGNSDSTEDATLFSTTNPSINWTGSAGADKYEVLVYANNGTTVVCTLQSTKMNVLDFSSCNLTPGLNYKASVWAKVNGSEGKLPAINNPFNFFVNSDPFLVDDTITISSGGMFSGNPITNSAGLDSDPDGDTMTLTAVGSASKGTVSISSPNQFTYIPSVGSYGFDSFTYSVSDTRGGVSTAIVRVNIMRTFTWTGAISTNWATSGNWCGSVSTPGFTGTCVGGAAPTSATNTSHIATIDETCSGSNCNPVISSNVTMYGLDVSAGYTGSITQSGASTITVGGGTWYQRGGNFIGGSGDITVGPATVTCANSEMGLSVTTSGTFQSTSGNLTLQVCDMTMTPGTFLNNNGRFTFYNQSTTPPSGSQSVTTGASRFYDMVISGTRNGVNFNNSTVYIDRDLSLTRTGAANTVDFATFEIVRNLNTTSCSEASTTNSTYKFVGSNSNWVGSSTSENCVIGHVEVNVSGIRYLSNFVSLGGNYSVLGGTVDPGTSTLEFVDYGLSQGFTSHSPGNFIYNNVSFTGHAGKFDFQGNTLNVGGTLSLNDPTVHADISNITLNLLGDLVVSGLGIRNGDYVVNMNGVNQSISGVSGAQVLDIIINSTGTVSLSGQLELIKEWHFLGTASLSAAGSTLRFRQYGTGNNYYFTLGNKTYGNVDIYTVSDLYFSNGTWLINGNLDVQGDSNTGISQVNFVVNGNVNLTGSGAFGGSTYYNSSSLTIVGTGRSINQGGSVALPALVLYIGDGVTTTSVTGNSRLDLNQMDQDLTIRNAATLTMLNSTTGVSLNDTFATTNTLTINSGGTLNMTGATLSYEALVNNGTLNP